MVTGDRGPGVPGDGEPHKGGAIGLLTPNLTQISVGKEYTFFVEFLSHFYWFSKH